MNEAILIWAYLAIGNALDVLCIVSAIGLFIYLVVMFAAWLEEEELFLILFKKLKLVVISAISIWCLAAVYPSKGELKWIIGGALVWNGVEAASDIKGIDKLPENAVNAMNHFLESIEDKNESE